MARKCKFGKHQIFIQIVKYYNFRPKQDNLNKSAIEETNQ